MSPLLICKRIAADAFFGRGSIKCLAGIRTSQEAMDSLREPLGYLIRADVHALCRHGLARHCVAPGEGRYSHHCWPTHAGMLAFGHLHSSCIGGSRFYCRYKVCAGKSRRNQICLRCHSHFSSASSEGMGLIGCSISRKGGEETNVNKNRLRCQSVSDRFGYPVLKVSKHIELLPWEESQRRLSSSWESSRATDANRSQSVSPGRVEGYLS